jgi:hypothetical protein
LPPRRDYGRDGKMGRVWVEKIIERFLHNTKENTRHEKSNLYKQKSTILFTK